MQELRAFGAPRGKAFEEAGYGGDAGYGYGDVVFYDTAMDELKIGVEYDGKTYAVMINSQVIQNMSFSLRNLTR